MRPRSPELWCHPVAAWSGTGFRVLCSLTAVSVFLQERWWLWLASFLSQLFASVLTLPWAQSFSIIQELPSLSEMGEALSSLLPAHGVQDLPGTVEQSGHNSIAELLLTKRLIHHICSQGFAGTVLKDKVCVLCWLAGCWVCVPKAWAPVLFDESQHIPRT